MKKNALIIAAVFTVSALLSHHTFATQPNQDVKQRSTKTVAQKAPLKNGETVTKETLRNEHKQNSKTHFDVVKATERYAKQRIKVAKTAAKASVIRDAARKKVLDAHEALVKEKKVEKKMKDELEAALAERKQSSPDKEKVSLSALPERSL